MPKANLLLRETLSSRSLTNIVEKSQHQKQPYLEYDLKFNSTKLDLVLLTNQSGKQFGDLPTNKPEKSGRNQIPKPHHLGSFQQHSDEGFESDIDSLSLISSDDSFTSSTCLIDDHVLKNHQETDSANGSSSSESETEHSPNTSLPSESFPLCDVVCYTDVTYPKVLIFVIKESVFVFNFENLDYLHSFYTSFNTLKAVTNQRTYGNNVNIGATFNLVHRTDSNGVTHIEINRDVVNLKVPESTNSEKSRISSDDSKIWLQDERRSSRREFYPNTTVNSFTLKPRQPPGKDTLVQNQTRPLVKVWKSVDSLLEEPKRPERRRKQKGKAPQPPVNQTGANVMKGQYVRVAVDPKNNPEKLSKPEVPNFQTFSSNIQTFTPNWNNIRTPQSPLVLTTSERQKLKQYEYRKHEEMQTVHRNQNWTNSVPRLLRKQRSKSETRPNLTPMAYRYIDTTQHLPKTPQPINSSSSISNRLFGLTQKLKEFGTNVVAKETHRGFTSYYEQVPTERRNSLGEMTYRKNSSEASLKSVIKKDDKKKCEKKVTFSAYATVQVV